MSTLVLSPHRKKILVATILVHLIMLFVLSNIRYKTQTESLSTLPRIVVRLLPPSLPENVTQSSPFLSLEKSNSKIDNVSVIKSSVNPNRSRRLNNNLVIERGESIVLENDNLPPVIQGGAPLGLSAENDVPFSIESPRLPASSPLINNTSRRLAIQNELSKRSPSSVANDSLRLSKASKAEAFSISVNESTKPDCLASNDNSKVVTKGLLRIPDIAYQALSGKCK